MPSEVSRVPDRGDDNKVLACSCQGSRKGDPQQVAFTDSDLSELLEAVKAGEMTDKIRTSVAWVLQQLIETE